MSPASCPPPARHPHRLGCHLRTPSPNPPQPATSPVTASLAAVEPRPGPHTAPRRGCTAVVSWCQPTSQMEVEAEQGLSGLPGRQSWDWTPSTGQPHCPPPAPPASPCPHPPRMPRGRHCTKKSRLLPRPQASTESLSASASCGDWDRVGDSQAPSAPAGVRWVRGVKPVLLSRAGAHLPLPSGPAESHLPGQLRCLLPPPHQVARSPPAHPSRSHIRVIPVTRRRSAHTPHPPTAPDKARTDITPAPGVPSTRTRCLEWDRNDRTWEEIGTCSL